jgi:hypothetical protein
MGRLWRMPRRPPSPALPPQTARGKGASVERRPRVGSRTRACHPEAQARRTGPQHTRRGPKDLAAEGKQARARQRSRSLRPRLPWGPHPAALGRLKSRQQRPKVRLRGLHAQSGAQSQPKRGSGLPLPCAAGEGGRGEGAPRDMRRIPSNPVRSAPLSRAVCGGEAGRGGSRGMRRGHSNPVRSSPLSRRSLPGEGPGEGPTCGARISRRSPPLFYQTKIASRCRIFPGKQTSSWPSAPSAPRARR